MASNSDMPFSPANRQSRSVWSYLRSYRASVLAGIVCILASTAAAMAIPWMVKDALAALKESGEDAPLASYALIIVGLAVAQGGIRILSRLFLFNSARRAEFDLRNHLFDHLLRLSPSYFRGASTGDVMSRLTVDVPSVRLLWGPALLNVVNTASMYITGIVLMCQISPRITLYALLPYPLLVLLGRAFSGRLFRLSRQVQTQMGQISATVQEDLVGIGVVKAYGLEPAREKNFVGQARSYLRKNMAIALTRGLMMPLFGAVGALAVVIIVFVGGHSIVSGHGELTLPGMIALMLYLGMLTWPTLAIGWLLSMFQRGFASYSRLLRVLDEVPSIQDGRGPALDAANVRGEITIRDLSLAVEDGELLSDISLSVPAGSMCAIVGRTGSGKSTLVDVIPRLTELPENKVFVDGVDVTTLPLSSLRGAIAYAPQESYLFSATIAHNIAFGRRPAANESIEEERAAVEAAAHQAGLARDLAGFPGGLDTMVGERGITLSGGQRQRVALARALASDAPVLILDDSLSSVDAQTERDILNRLVAARADGADASTPALTPALTPARTPARTRARTALVISHRIAAVSGADQIIVLDEGRIVQRGTHQELVEQGGVYAELYREQLADQALVEVA